MSKSRVNFVDTATVLSSHSPESSIVKCRTNKLGAVMLTLMGILFGLSLIYLISRMIKISKNISSIEYFMGKNEVAPSEEQQPRLSMQDLMPPRLRTVISRHHVDEEKEKKQPINNNNIRRELVTKKQEEVKKEEQKEAEPVKEPVKEAEEVDETEKVDEVEEADEVEEVEEVEENTQEFEASKKDEVSFDVHILRFDSGGGGCIIASNADDASKQAPRKRGRPPKSLPLVLEA